MKFHFDFIIVGAGAAGIACAQYLHEQGYDFLLLEARPRIGGRIFNMESSNSLPIELGAEFIHGVPDILLNLFQKFELPFYDVRDAHLFKKGNKLIQIPDFWEKIGDIAERISKRKPDVSVMDFLKSQKSMDSETRSMFISFVEGFQAADLNIMGKDALAEEMGESEENLNGSKTFRPLFSYKNFLEALAKDFMKDRLKLNTELKKIDWEKGKVRLQCIENTEQEKIYECKKLILTLPIGVLKSNQIGWNQKPTDLDLCLNSIHMGHVQKIIFNFKTRFWENLTECPISFIHGSTNEYFPTWWTQSPMRTFQLVAWQGGPKALRLGDMTEDKRINLALKSLSLITKKSVSWLRNHISSYHTHNWSKDPYALGAYSYVGINGLTAVKKIRRGFANTIYFAGEGMAEADERGTVHGALSTGIHAAKLATRKHISTRQK